MTDPFGPVQITGRDIYDALIRLTASVDRLTSQSDGHGEDLRDHETRLRVVEEVRPAPRIADLESRIRAVEARQWPLPAASLLVALAALAIGLLPKFTT